MKWEINILTKNTNLHKIYTAPGLESGRKSSKYEKKMDNMRAVEDMSVNEQKKESMAC